MSGHAERYRSTFAFLARPLGAGDGYPEGIVSEAERRLGIRMPEALRAYYITAGRFDQFHRAHDRLLRPEDWSLDAGMLVFLVENQSVVVWGVEARPSPGDDPPVSQAANDPGRPSDWRIEHERCSGFLLVHLHWQAVCGGFEHLGMTDITPEALEGFLAGWSLVGRIGELRAYSRDGRAACVIHGDGSLQLYAGGSTEAELDAMESELEGFGVGIDRL